VDDGHKTAGEPSKINRCLHTASTFSRDKNIAGAPHLSCCSGLLDPDTGLTGVSSTNPQALLLQLIYINIIYTKNVDVEKKPRAPHLLRFAPWYLLMIQFAAIGKTDE
jgi:hypothetical protein